MDEIPEVYPHIAHWIEQCAAKSNGRYLAVDILRNLLCGHWELWTIAYGGPPTLCMMAYRVQYPRLLAYEPIAVIGDNAQDMLWAIPQIEDHVRKTGCGLVRVTAPIAWKRLMAPLGYGDDHIVLVKEL